MNSGTTNEFNWTKIPQPTPKQTHILEAMMLIQHGFNIVCLLVQHFNQTERVSVMKIKKTMKTNDKPFFVPKLNLGVSEGHKQFNTIRFTTQYDIHVSLKWHTES